MKISLSQPQLAQLAGTAGNVVPSKSTLPILSTLLLRADKEGLAVSATDLDISIHLIAEAEVKTAGAAAVPARRFSEIVRKLDAVDVLLELEKDSLAIRCGRSFFQIGTMPPDDFPKLPVTKGIEPFFAPAGTIKDMIRRTRFAVSQDLARPSMNGIHMSIDAEKILMVATDGHRLSFCKRNETLPLKQTHGVILPTKALDQLLRLLPDEGDVELGITENQAFFKSSAFTLFTRLIEGPYPNYRQVIPQTNDKLLVLNTANLLTAVDRVSTLAASLTTKQIKLSLDKDLLALEVASPDVGRAREELEASYDGEPMSIGYNASYLLDVLKHIHTDEVRFRLDRPDNAGIIEPGEQQEGEEYFSLLMPLKLSD